jgi:uncharacterized protein YidB (DUF937 family)
MGLLDSVMGVLSNVQGGQGGQGGGSADLIGAVVGMLGNDASGGGIGGLVSKFAQHGLGDVINSWIGTGQNQAIGADQISQVLGSDAVTGLAQKLGLSSGDMAGQLSQMLPQIIDQLTPHGQVPQGGLGNVSDILGMLLKR